MDFNKVGHSEKNSRFIEGKQDGNSIGAKRCWSQPKTKKSTNEWVNFTTFSLIVYLVHQIWMWLKGEIRQIFVILIDFRSVVFTLESWREKKRKLNQLEKMCTNHHIALCTLQYCFFIDKRDFYEAQVTFFVENSAIKKILGDVDRKFQDSMTIFINIFLQNCIFDSIFLWVIFNISIFSFNYITG